MAQSSAPREEPSMEDILSSIRKIIQSNESDGGAVEAPTSQVAPQAAMQSSAPVAQAPVAQAPVASAPFVPAAPVAPAIKAVTTPAAPSAQVDTTDDGELTAAPERARQVVGKVDMPQVHASEMQSVADAEVDAAPAQLNKLASVMADVEKEASAAMPALISAGSEAKVIASFAQLNEAMSANSSKSLEEMSSDMLKPMLQEWLDNNLPGLVERLVREEIERVARGGHQD